MPIQFPPPLRGNMFDRFLWQRGAKPPQQQIQPNMFRPGKPFSVSLNEPLLPGQADNLPWGQSMALRSPGRKSYQYGALNSLRPNSAQENLKSARRINDGSTIHLVAVTYGILRTRLTGVSRNNAGAPLGDCQVLIFRTNTKAFVGETVSDGSGNWSFDVMTGGGPFFLVVYKAGAPDVAGTSLNTLVPDVVIS